MEFAYLVDLSRKDAILRELILDLALDLEHYLKVAVNRVLMSSGIRTDTLITDFIAFSKGKALSRIAEQPFDGRFWDTAKDLSEVTAKFSAGCSGELLRNVTAADCSKIFSLAYELVRGVDCDHIERSFEHLGSSFYSRDLVRKYGRVAVMEPWHFMEMASFGDFIAFYKYLFFDSSDHRHFKICQDCAEDAAVAKRIKKLLFPAKTLRNAAAHNDCLLNGLKRRMGEPFKPIRNFLIKECDLSETIVENAWKTSVVHDYTALLICYDLVVPNGETKSRAAQNMRVAGSALRTNMDYYSDQENVLNVLQLLSLIIECLSDRWGLGRTSEA